ncbi:MAG TPA: peptidoglycan DD-metalloendopeptidase family protein [Candidatus Limnocylindrales bacterium]
MIVRGERGPGAAGPGVGRAALVVAAIVAGAVGHLFLAPSAGARAPAVPGSPPTAAFEPLRLPGVGAGQAAGPPDEAGAAPELGGADSWGLTLSTVTGSLPARTIEPEPPAVVRFRPRNGWVDVDRHAQLSVRFTAAMDHATTEAAFRASIDRAEIGGTVSWAEGETVLVLDPAEPLPYGAHVELRVDVGALSADGLPLNEPVSVGFTVEARPVAPVAPVGGGGSSAWGWQWPLVGPITQRFGESLTAYGFHQGIDIDGDTGDPVTAAASGTVVVAGHADECGGLQVRIDHGGGLLSWYRHLSAIDTWVGARVVTGTVIGRVGNTGCSLGSHLHFGVSLDGDFVDPLRYLPAR